MPPTNPHFSLPFRFNFQRGGRLGIAVTEQDTTDEIADCVELCVRTYQGQRPTLPGFGRPQMLLFTTQRELARSLLQQAIDEAEPRVEALIQKDAPDASDEGLMRLLAMYELQTGEEFE